MELGEELVKLAREAVTSHFLKKDIQPKDLEQKKGVFVTILTLDGELRGCIGFVEPIYSLGEGIIKAAKHAAFSDPRFSPLKEKELDEIKFEVSILTEPQLIEVENPEEYLEKIKIGEDGLIAECEDFKGLLLPNVAVEQNWNTEQFLEHTCMKAGLLVETWKQPACKIYKFRTQIFKEKTKSI